MGDGIVLDYRERKKSFALSREEMDLRQLEFSTFTLVALSLHGTYIAEKPLIFLVQSEEP